MSVLPPLHIAQSPAPSSKEETAVIATGKALRQARRLRRISQTDLAAFVGVSQSRIAAWENSYDDIPFRHRMKLIDLLTNRKGVFDPFVKKLIKTDPGIVIKDKKSTRYKFVADGLLRRFFRPTDNIYGCSPCQVHGWGMREFDFVKLTYAAGRTASSMSVALDAERDVPTVDGKSLRLLSNEFALHFEDYPGLIVSSYQCVGAGVGAPAVLNNHLLLEDLDRH